jgi:hypothetical protein
MDNGADMTHGDGDGREDILVQIKTYLDGLDTWENDRATEDDLIIVEGLLHVVRAARRKGYSIDLLVEVLRGLVRDSPETSE